MAHHSEKVLIITYYWPPAGGAGVQRWVKFSKYLKNNGYQPVVLTVKPEKASYALTDATFDREVTGVEVHRTDTFEPFQAYKKLLGKKEIPYAGFANETEPGWLEKVSRFVRGNFFIPDARRGWNRYALPMARQLIKKYGIRNLVTTSPPHSTQLTGLKLKAEFRLNWIADLRDPWTDIYYYPLMYHTLWARNRDKKWEQRVLQNADKVVVVSDAIKNLYLAKAGTGTEGKFHVIPNGFDEADFIGAQPKKNRVFTITYTGTIAENYHIETFLEVLGEFSPEKFRLRFVGRVAEKYKILAGRSGWGDNVLFIPHVRHGRAVEYMVSSDLLLLAIPDVPDNEGILTGKLFEYLASGVPILGVGPVNGDAAGIVRNCNAGQMFDYGDAAGMKSFLSEKFHEFDTGNTKPREPRCRQFSREALTSQIARLFK